MLRVTPAMITDYRQEVMLWSRLRPSYAISLHVMIAIKAYLSVGQRQQPSNVATALTLMAFSLAHGLYAQAIIALEQVF